jgi:hypothetical protein
VRACRLCPPGEFGDFGTGEPAVDQVDRGDPVDQQEVTSGPAPDRLDDLGREPAASRPRRSKLPPNSSSRSAIRGAHGERVLGVTAGVQDLQRDHAARGVHRLAAEAVLRQVAGVIQGRRSFLDPAGGIG